MPTKRGYRRRGKKVGSTRLAYAIKSAGKKGIEAYLGATQKAADVISDKMSGSEMLKKAMKTPSRRRRRSQK